MVKLKWNNYIGSEFLIDPKMCDRIISFGNKKLPDHGTFETKNRNDQGVELTVFGSYKETRLYSKIEEVINDCTKEFIRINCVNKNIDGYYNDSHKFQKAEAQGGFYSWHHESAGKDGLNGTRAFVWMLYLNTVEQGGQTQFWQNPENILEIKPEQGKFVFWPAGETHYHRSKPDLNETKYILTGWVHRK
jgi:hypothetical protein